MDLPSACKITEHPATKGSADGAKDLDFFNATEPPIFLDDKSMPVAGCNLLLRALRLSECQRAQWISLLDFGKQQDDGVDHIG